MCPVAVLWTWDRSTKNRGKKRSWACLSSGPSFSLPLVHPCGRGWLAGWHTCFLSSRTHGQTARTNLPRIAVWPWDRGLATGMWVKENLQVLSWAWITNSILHSLFPTRQLEGEGTQVLNKGTDQRWKEPRSLSQHLGKKRSLRMVTWPGSHYWLKETFPVLHHPKLGAAGCRSWPSVNSHSSSPYSFEWRLQTVNVSLKFPNILYTSQKKKKNLTMLKQTLIQLYIYNIYFSYSFPLSFITGCWI